ncbi:MAG: RNA polymerase sigma factor [Pedosphaera sp.]|nr:RNA polymerase sigma factor [Pedosphaera sp.]
MNDQSGSTELSDYEDMSALVSGEDLALNRLMDRHGERLFHYLIRLLQNETEADELAQETFVRVYLNRQRFDAKKKFTTWLYSIATNLARDHWRRRSRHPQVSLDAPSTDSEQTLANVLPSEQHSPSEEFEREDNARLVREALADLPEDLRTPLVLAAYEDMPQAEIALALGCTAKAVENRIYRARQRLRAFLARAFSVTR